MRRLRRIPSPAKLIRETDNLVLLLVGIGIGLAFTLILQPYVLPRVAPFVKTGVSCNRLAPPLGGNSRSLLAVAGDSFQQLGLDIQLENTTLSPGEPLSIDVILKNEDMGSIILFMPPNEDMVLNSPATIGVSLEVRDIITNQVLRYGIPAAAVPQEATFRNAEIHLLQSNERCKQSYQLDTGLQVGEYSIIAFYNSSRAGVRRNIPGEVPDPNFPDQGVWNGGQIESPELRFRVVVPQPTAPPL